MKSLFSIIISAALVVSGFGQTRNVLVGTNNAVVQPTNFWSADASNARTGLGLGTAATNPASAFQPSSVTLTSLASSNGGALTNLVSSNIVGTLSLGQGGTGATNASGARMALGLGTAATNPASAFQTSSSVLTNLAAGNGGDLTNIVANKIVGTVALASNISGTAPLATNVTGVIALLNGGTGGTNAESARNGLGATTVGANLFTLDNPDDVRFIRLNANNSVSVLSASDMRTELSVGTNSGTVTSVGMTVPNIFSLSTPTITSSGTFGLTLTNQSSRQAFLAPNGGGVPAFRALESDDLPSLAISKITGLQTALDGKLSTTGTAALATNVTGVVALANGGTGGTNAESGRTGLGATTVGSSIFTLLNPSAVRFLRLNADNTVSALSDSDFRTAIGLGTAATNPATAFQPSSSVLTNLAANNGSSLTNIPVAGVVGALATNGNGAGLTNLTAANITGTVALASNVTGTIAISNGGSGATTAGGARTNFGLGESDGVTFSTIRSTQVANSGIYNITMGQTNTGFKGVGAGPSDFGYYRDGSLIWSATGANFTISSGLSFSGSSAGVSRTNLGIPWSGLTNTTASGFQTALFGTGTNPVLVNTNGEVVSPTNFWQAAPIATTLQNSAPNATNTTATNARLLFLFSLVPTTTGLTNAIFTNTVSLPTNGNTFNGDVATITHNGGSNTVTAIRELGASTNLITINQVGETVRFLYRDNQWELMDNISYIEPIYFSGTNATANAAASRTNLGLGWSALTNTNAQGFYTSTLTAYSLISSAITEDPDFAREDLGIPLPALTNTNNANFQAAVFNTNAAPTNTANVNGVGFNTAVGWMEVTVQTNGTNATFRIPLFQ